MKNYLSFTLISIALACTIFSKAQAYGDDETTFFDFKGRASAYVADDRTIYLWSGKPVAYLESDSLSRGDIHVYGFNGKHLGWFSKGIIYDHEGLAVGGVKGVFSSPTELGGLKSLKELKPLKSLKELAPLKPIFQKQWSEVPLRIFLALGAND
jgi:hypothetical protein